MFQLHPSESSACSWIPVGPHPVVSALAPSAFVTISSSSCSVLSSRGMSASTAIFDESKQRLQSQLSSRHSMAHALAHKMTSVSSTNELMSPESCVSLESRSAYAWIWLARSNLRLRHDAHSNRC